MTWNRGFFAGALFCACWTAGWSLPITEISINPSAQTVGYGSIFSVDVLISEAVELSGFDLLVSFDPKIISWLGSTIPLTAFLGNSPVDAFYIIDELGVAGVHLGPTGVSGSGTLFSLTFQALEQGVSNIDVSGQLVNSSVQEISQVKINNGMVEVVPEPLTIALMGGGYLGLIAFRVKRDRKR